MQTENHHNAVADITLPPWRREEIISVLPKVNLDFFRKAYKVD